MNKIETTNSSRKETAENKSEQVGKNRNEERENGKKK